MAESTTKQRATKSVADQSAQIFGAFEKFFNTIGEIGVLPNDLLRMASRYAGEAAKKSLEAMAEKALEENDTIQALEEAAIQAASEIGAPNQAQDSTNQTPQPRQPSPNTNQNVSTDKKTEAWEKAGEQAADSRNAAFSNTPTRTDEKKPGQTMGGETSPEQNPEEVNAEEAPSAEDLEHEKLLEREYEHAHEIENQERLRKENEDRRTDRPPTAQEHEEVQNAETEIQEYDKQPENQKAGFLKRIQLQHQLKKLTNELITQQKQAERAARRATRPIQKKIDEKRKIQAALKRKLAATYFKLIAKGFWYSMIIAIGLIMLAISAVLFIIIPLGLLLGEAAINVIWYGSRNLGVSLHKHRKEINDISKKMEINQREIKTLQKDIMLIQKISYEKFQKDTAPIRQKIAAINSQISEPEQDDEN